MTQTPRGMAVTMLAIVFLVAGCWGGADTSDSTGSGAAGLREPSLPVRGTIQWPSRGKGEEVSGHMKKEQLVFRTKAEMLKVWVADGGTEKEPQRFYQRFYRLPVENGDKESEVDFDQEMVLAVFSGLTNWKSSIRIEQVMPKANGLVVEFRESETQGEGPPPSPACPYDMLVVDRVEGAVKFKALELRINKH
jgi:hypothetical protein